MQVERARGFRIYILCEIIVERPKNRYLFSLAELALLAKLLGWWILGRFNIHEIYSEPKMPALSPFKGPVQSILILFQFP